MKSHADRVTRLASQRNEILSAHVQIMVPGMLVIPVAAIRDDLPLATPSIVLRGTWALGAAINLMLTRIGFYRV